MKESLYYNEFKFAGKLCKEMEWTDNELKEVIDKLKCVIDFLDAREDSGIIVSKLRIELNYFYEIAYSRGIIK